MPEFQQVCFKGVDPFEIVDNFDKLVGYYLNIDMKDECCMRYSVCGGQFYDDVIFKRLSVYKTKLTFSLGRLRE